MTYKKLIFTGLVSGALLVSPFSGLAQTDKDRAVSENPSPYPTKSYPESEKAKDKTDPAYAYETDLDATGEVAVETGTDHASVEYSADTDTSLNTSDSDFQASAQQDDVMVEVTPAEDASVAINSGEADATVSIQDEPDALTGRPSPSPQHRTMNLPDDPVADYESDARIDPDATVAAASSAEIETERDTTVGAAEIEADADLDTDAGFEADADVALSADVDAQKSENDALAQNPAPNPDKRSMNQPGKKPEGEPLFGARSETEVTTTDVDVASTELEADIDAQATQPELQTQTTTGASVATTSDSDGQILEAVDDDLETGPSSIAVINAGDTLGWDVVDAEGNKLGDLTDYAIRPEEQEIAYLIVTAGGILGVGGKDHFLDISSVERINDDNQLVVSLSEEEFNQTSNIDASDQDSLIRFFSDVEGEQAVSEDGYELGAIQDMLVRFEGGNVAHLIINPGTTFTADWGYGFDVAVPASEVMELKDNDELVLGVNQQEVLNAELADNKEDVRLLETSAGNVFRIDLSGGETALR